MSDVSKYSLSSLDQDWGAHPSDNLPVSGAEVQRFIKQYLQLAAEATTTLDKRFGYFRFVGTKIQFFATEGDATAYDNGDTDKLIREGELPTTGSGSSLYYRLNVINGLDSWSFYASTGQPALIKFTFTSQVSQDGGVTYEDTNERGVVKISVKKPSDSTYVEAQTLYVPSNVLQSIDVSSLLGGGSNQVKVEVVGEDTGEKALARVYTITVTSLSISASTFNWAIPFQGNIMLPLYVSGNIAKTLVVSIDGNNYSQAYTQAIGTASYTEQPYNFTIPHPGASGVYTINASVQNADGSLVVPIAPVQVICVVSGDQGKYMAINNVAEDLTNWVESRVFDYALYDAEATSSSVTFTVDKDGEVVNTSSLDAVPTGVKQTLSVLLNISTNTNDDFSVSVDAGDLMDAIAFTVSNAFNFAPVPGAVFQLSATNRSNSESNRAVIINDITGEEVPTELTNMNWSNDGWQSAYDGKVLRLQAGSKLTIGVQPLADMTQYDKGKTLIFDFRCENVLRYDNPIITIQDTVEAKRASLTVYPDMAVLTSQYQYSDQEKEYQSTKFEDGARVRMTIVILPKAYGNTGFHIVRVYINNNVVREFTFSAGDKFLSQGKLIFGSDDADIDIYSTFVYNKALSRGEVQTNHVNLLATLAEKQSLVAKNDVFDDGVVSFEKVRQLCNVVVFERGANNTLPNFIPSYTNQVTSLLNWHILWRDTPENNIIIRNYPTDGQGTTAKTYYLWNQRGKADDDTIIEYADGTTSVKSFVFLPGYGKCERLTAKLNFASSPQSNKMGSVNSIQDLMEYLGIANDDNSRFAIYQRPFSGFSLDTNEEGQQVYTYLGLYTIGPDKGDKKTMGTDLATYPHQLSFEGSDNERQPTQFKVPWLEVENGVTMYRYNAVEEYWEYRVGETSWEGCWDVNAGDPTDADAVADWAAFQNFVYSCSPRITFFNGTLDELNAQVAILKNIDTEYWLSGGGVYYYQRYAGKYVPSSIGDGQINLYTQLVDQGYGLTSVDIEGKTADELNALFIKARIKKFGAELGNYAYEDSLYFARNWTEFMDAKDNRAKNTYYKKSLLLAAGGRWNAWFDDTDTIGPFINIGQDRGRYYDEPGDTFDNGAAVFNADGSRLFLLLDAQTDRVQDTMTAMLSAMVALSGSNKSLYADRLFDFFHRYYFGQAQEYFPDALYNEATRVVYEASYLSGITFNPSPITQALGNYYSGWKRWAKKRIQYMMSKYSFGEYSKDGADHIVFRAQTTGETNFEITPAIWMYPNIASGESIVRGERTKAGEMCNMLVQTGGDQQVRIKGAHYLQSIGSWYNKLVTGQFEVTGRMLRELILGNEDATAEDWAINISSLELKQTPSLQVIDLRNIASLAGTLNLGVVRDAAGNVSSLGCTHLRYLYAQGTALAAITLPKGGGLRYVGYPSTNQRVELRNFPLLTNENIELGDCAPNVSAVFVEECPQVLSVALLAGVIEAQKGQETHTLQNVRLTGFDESYSAEEGGADILTRLSKLTDGTYSGLDQEGIPSDDLPKPILQGKLSIDAYAYEDDVIKLRNFFGQNLDLSVLGAYLYFADDAVKEVLIANGVSSDGVGITTADVEKVTSIGTWFKGNTEITSFDEFEKFTGIKQIYTAWEKQPFGGCTSLEYITLPRGLEVLSSNPTYGVFEGCTALKRVRFSTPVQIMRGPAFSNCSSLTALEGYDMSIVTELGSGLFRGCKSLEMVADYPLITGSIYQTFAESKLTEVKSLGTITQLSKGGYANGTYVGAFWKCAMLKKAILPETVELIEVDTFYQCTSLSILICNAVTPPGLGNIRCFEGTPIASGTGYIYVPDASVDAYKAATNWATYADQIKPLSEYTE